MKERKIRVGPWDCDEKLLDRVSLYRAQQGGKPWTWVLHKALREMMDREQVFIGAHADNVESVSNPVPVSISSPAVPVVSAVGLSGVPASVVPASVVSGVPAVGLPVVELTENEKRLERLIGRRATKQAFLDEAPLELEREPGSLRALNWLKVMPKEVASYDVEIEACKAAIAAEKLAKENTGEVERGEEV